MHILHVISVIIIHLLRVKSVMIEFLQGLGPKSDLKVWIKNR